MKKRFKEIKLMFLALAMLICGAVAGGDLPGKVSTKTFKEPPNEFRLVQYQLSPGSLKDYPDWGIGGYMGFFYNQLYKQGAKGPKKIGKLVDAANKSGRTVWLADDWGYPSGMAGGRVVAENSDFQVKSLVMLSKKGNGPGPVNYDLPKDMHDIVYAAIYPLKGKEVDTKAGTPIEVKGRKVSAKGLQGAWELRVFARYVRSNNTQAQSTMKQFGHTGRYPDLMNRKAMSRFIANMHEPILKEIKSPGKKVEGFYCNEPNLMQTYWNGNGSYPCAPWSDALPALFKEMHGYELFSIIPYLFEGNSIEAKRARIHYRQAVGELLTDSFARQIRLWCNKKGVKSSGHFLLNDYLSQHVQGYGDMMQFVSEFDVPALDIPIPNPNQFMNFRYQQSRFFSSVTSWKKRDTTLMLLDPIIGGYGRGRLSPDLPLLINSVNMASFHGVNIFTSYIPRTPGKNAKGYTKEQYRFLNEYSGRITQVLRGAQRDAGVGLYYPIAMFQADMKASNKRWTQIVGENKRRQGDWDKVEGALLSGDIEYLIVHPKGVAQSEIKEGKMTIGDGTYHTIVMPQMEIIPLAVASKLEAFKKSGGKVLWIDKVPGSAEFAKNDPAVKKGLGNAKSIPANKLKVSIPKGYSSAFDLTFTPGADQLNVGRFRQDGKLVYLLVNRLQKDITVDVKGSGKGKLLDPSTGKISSVSFPAKLPIKATRALMLIPERKRR